MPENEQGEEFSSARLNRVGSAQVLTTSLRLTELLVFRASRRQTKRRPADPQRER
jgi:hypothetical protein